MTPTKHPLDEILESLPPHDAQLIRLGYRFKEYVAAQEYFEYYMCWQGRMDVEGNGIFVRRNGQVVRLPLQIEIPEAMYESMTSHTLPSRNLHLVTGLASFGH